MAKVIYFLLAVLCGLASINVSFAEPSTMYGATPAKYPTPAAPASYPAAPAKYEAPAPPAPPAPAKYEAEKPKYEEMKKEEYPMKMEYKTEETPAEYNKKEEKLPEYGGGKKYRRSIIDDEEEEEQFEFDPIRSNIPKRVPISPSLIKVIRDAVIMKLVSENDPGFGIPFRPRFPVLADPFSMMNDPRRGGKGIGGAIVDAIGSIFGDESYSTVNDPKKGGLGKVGANFARGVLGGILGADERACWNMGLSRKQTKLVQDAVMMAALNDPGKFRSNFLGSVAKNSAEAVGSAVAKRFGADPFSLTVQDLVEMYGRDPAPKKKTRKITWSNRW